MGFGDEILGSGLARGAAARGKRIAFGNGEKIIHSWPATEIYKNNPNIARPGDEGASDLEWVAHYSGSRIYIRDITPDRWIFAAGHNDKPGEIYFDGEELEYAEKCGSGFVLMEPNVPLFKAHARNKQWPVERYQEVAHRLRRNGYEVVQFKYSAPWGPGTRLLNARHIIAPTFRLALAVLARARLYVGPEGGLHHGAAAVGTPAVVIFGGFVSPEITGYSAHHNIYAGGEPCGSQRACLHCASAMHSISMGRVYDAVLEELSRGTSINKPG